MDANWLRDVCTKVRSTSWIPLSPPLWTNRDIETILMHIANKSEDVSGRICMRHNEGDVYKEPEIKEPNILFFNWKNLISPALIRR